MNMGKEDAITHITAKTSINVKRRELMAWGSVTSTTCISPENLKKKKHKSLAITWLFGQNKPIDNASSWCSIKESHQATDHSTKKAVVNTDTCTSTSNKVDKVAQE